MLVLLFCLVICACVLFLCSAILGKPYKSTVKSYNNNIYIIYIYIYIYIQWRPKYIYINIDGMYEEFCGSVFECLERKQIKQLAREG